MATTSPALPESLPPHELRNAMKRTLNATLTGFDSDEFQAKLDAMPEEDRKKASITRGEVYRAGRKLGNLQLDDIRDKLVENEPALRKATDSLDQALKDLTKVAKILDVANKMLEITAKAIAIL